MLPVHIYPSTSTPGRFEFDANRDSPRLLQLPANIRVKFLTPKPGERTVLLEKHVLLGYVRDPYSEPVQAALLKHYTEGV
jgi:hypothetical protein